MDFKSFIDDEDAVSPVIGVILMVAITVILAAVIGTFVLGLGDQVQSTSPNTNWAMDYNDDYDPDANEGDSLKMTHDGGTSIEGNALSLRVSGAAYNDSGGTTADTFDTEVFTADEYNAGASETLNHSHFQTADDGSGNELYLGEATVRIVWQAEGSDQSSTLKVWEGPDA